MNFPSRRILRGLGWLLDRAAADYDACSGERGTGQFAGTTSREVADAIEWLRRFLAEGAS